MNTIKVKISNSQIDVLNDALEILKGASFNNRHNKVIRSVLLPFSFKLIKKRHNGYSNTKKFNLSLKVYEAHYLELLLIQYCNITICNYSQNVCLLIKNELNQKLS